MPVFTLSKLLCTLQCKTVHLRKKKKTTTTNKKETIMFILEKRKIDILFVKAFQPFDA